MTHFTWLAGIGLGILLAACSGQASPSATETAATTRIAVTPIAPTGIATTPIVSTAQVGTAEPVTSVPLDQVTPVTYIPPTLTPIPTLPAALGPTELKYRLLAQFPDFFFCDPDYYPVARADEMELARQRFPEIQANAEEFNTILAHNGLSGVTSFTDDQMLLIYREHKKLAAIRFELADGGYSFQIQVARTEGEGELIAGVIDGQGTITVSSREATLVTCPICLVADTWIDAPDGPVRVQELLAGMPVWTLDAAGNRVAQPLIRVGKTAAPASHRVIHLVLSDGRELWVSPGHPTADGRSVGQLRVGDSLDGAVIVSAEQVSYSGYATYDLLPAGDTGFYWANGILLASSLTPH